MNFLKKDIENTNNDKDYHFNTLFVLNYKKNRYFVFDNIEYTNKIFKNANDYFICVKLFKNMLKEGNIFAYLLLNNANVKNENDNLKLFKVEIILSDNNIKIINYIKKLLEENNFLEVRTKLKLFYVIIQILDGKDIFLVDIELINFKQYILESKCKLITKEQLEVIDNFINKNIKNIKNIYKIINNFKNKLYKYIELFM